MLSNEDNELITCTGPDTPMGKVFREYWLPAMLSRELPGRGALRHLASTTRSGMPSDPVG